VAIVIGLHCDKRGRPFSWAVWVSRQTSQIERTDPSRAVMVRGWNSLMQCGRC